MVSEGELAGDGVKARLEGFEAAVAGVSSMTDDTLARGEYEVSGPTPTVTKGWLGGEVPWNNLPGMKSGMPVSLSGSFVVDL